MMNNIEILSEDKILTIKNNQNEVVKYISESSDNSWLKDFFCDENPFIRSKIQVEDFDLVIPTSPKEFTRVDLENAILLHKNLKITDSQASDERLWVGLCFGKFYDYMRARWPIEVSRTFQEHWSWRSNSGRRSLFFNGISRLYWFAKMTYDDTLDDPYELTKYCFNDINIVIQMSYRAYSNSKPVRLALIKALKAFKEYGGTYNRDILFLAIKYVSFLGGAYILDSFSEEELFDKIYRKLIDSQKQLSINPNTFKL